MTIVCPRDSSVTIVVGLLQTASDKKYNAVLTESYTRTFRAEDRALHIMTQRRTQLTQTSDLLKSNSAFGR